MCNYIETKFLFLFCAGLTYIQFPFYFWLLLRQFFTLDLAILMCLITVHLEMAMHADNSESLNRNVPSP